MTCSSCGALSLLGAAGAQCWLFGGWAEELQGVCPARGHQDFDLPSQAQCASTGWVAQTRVRTTPAAAVRGAVLLASRELASERPPAGGASTPRVAASGPSADATPSRRMQSPARPSWALLLLHKRSSESSCAARSPQSTREQDSRSPATSARLIGRRASRQPARASQDAPPRWGNRRCRDPEGECQVPTRISACGQISSHCCRRHASRASRLPGC